jgi:hypothetical protein
MRFFELSCLTIQVSFSNSPLEFTSHESDHAHLFHIVQMKNPVYSSVIIRERFSSLRFMKLGEVE